MNFVSRDAEVLMGENSVRLKTSSDCIRLLKSTKSIKRCEKSRIFECGLMIIYTIELAVVEIYVHCTLPVRFFCRFVSF